MGEREKGGEGGGENALGAVHHGVCLGVGLLGGSSNKQHPSTHTPLQSTPPTPPSSPCVYPTKNSPPLFGVKGGMGGRSHLKEPWPFLTPTHTGESDTYVSVFAATNT